MSTHRSYLIVYRTYLNLCNLLHSRSNSRRGAEAAPEEQGVDGVGGHCGTNLSQHRVRQEPGRAAGGAAEGTGLRTHHGKFPGRTTAPRC